MEDDILQGVKSILRLRKQIDRLDARIVALLGQRAKANLRLGKLKKKSGVSIFDPGRERKVLARVKRLSRGLFPSASLIRLYKEIFRASKAIQRRGRR